MASLRRSWRAQSSPSRGDQRLTARTLRVYEAPEADQGVAVDATFFYPVDNSVIAKYDIASGKRIDRWDGTADGLIRHLNSCLADAGRLWCANSNYPQTPMGSSIEVFDTATLDHVTSHSLGLLDEGSITWFDRYQGGFIAGFAHYDGGNGVGFKDHRYSSVVTFDAEWRRTGGWLFPSTVVERMAPDAASGGAIGPDGWLYLLGHDRPEMYVVGAARDGPDADSRRDDRSRGRRPGLLVGAGRLAHDLHDRSPEGPGARDRDPRDPVASAHALKFR